MVRQLELLSPALRRITLPSFFSKTNTRVDRGHGLQQPQLPPKKSPGPFPEENLLVGIRFECNVVRDWPRTPLAIG